MKPVDKKSAILPFPGGRLVSPITGGTEVEFVRWYETERIVLQYQKEWGVDVSRFFTGLNVIPLFTCLKTGYRFFQPPSLAGDTAFYEQLASRKEYHLDFKKWEVDFALRFIEEKSRVLDIGCGDGLNAKFLSEKAQLVEATEQNRISRTLAQARGVKPFAESLEKLREIRSRSYDVITLFQVLEHVYDLREFLGNIERLLAPKGKLVVAVPNCNPYFFGTEDYYTLNLPPHHVGMWNKESLTRLAEVRGYRLLALEEEPSTELEKGRAIVAVFGL